MFLESFQSTVLAVMQIFLLGAIGYFLVKKTVLGEACLATLSRLTMEVTLPLLIFCQLTGGFSFSAYRNWWIFPLLSILITFSGFIAGLAFSGFIRGSQHKLQFVSLIAFQNSGYLPIALLAALLPKDKLDTMFIYLFLFLAGFNLMMFSLGAHIVTFSREKKFELGSLFSPPVIATLVSLVLVFFGANKFIPAFVSKPLRMIGDCTLPLAMFVVGGSLAQIRLGHVDKKAAALLVLAKMLILPALGLLLILKLKLPELIGLLILVQLAMPSATTLSVLTRHYKKEDLLISQGIFFSHLASMITLPVFLSLYFSLSVVK